MRAPSLKTLRQQLSRYAGKMTFSVETTAKMIRLMILDIPDHHKMIDRVLDHCNTLLHGYGVESIQGHEQIDRYYYNIHILYVNMGDTYEPTILYDTLKERWYCCSWGDIVEANPRRFE